MSKQPISVAELKESVNQSPEGVFIIDLMGSEEFGAGHIPGAVNIPLEELGNRLSEVPRDKTVVLACRKGLMKSDMGLELLNKSGFSDFTKLEGGTSCWFEANSLS